MGQQADSSNGNGDGQYSVVFPEKMKARHLLKNLVHSQNKKVDYSSFAQWPQQSTKQAFGDSWKTILSLLVMRVLHLLYYPLKILGFVVEFVLNFAYLNGGICRSFFRLITGRLQIPKKGTENFQSVIGLLERRQDLYKIERDVLEGGKVQHPPESPGDRFYVDLCAMASSVAYENDKVIQNRVTKRWKMHFVKYFDLWNERLKTYDTQAYIFTDRKEDANLIVLAFRGTEPFNANDWQTDVDLSWYKIPYVGRVHLGFMEALGVANRHDATDIIKNLNLKLRNTEQPNKPLAYYALVYHLKKLLDTHKDAKLLVTGHSLGGALAILFASVLVLKNEDEILGRLTGVYTFGQPRVGDEEFGSYVAKKLDKPVPRYYRIVYCNDLVPRVPFDDNIFLFKHFGSCYYYASFFSLQKLRDEPLKNMSLSYIVSSTLNAGWEATVCFFLPYFRGDEYRETWLCTITRFTAGLLFPGVVSHCLVNYVHSARLGPPSLQLD
eukprot:TRINITY_DN4906_c0_g1_i1.p1 TRINITY_DN4906_c0_g1~~TRINITY_DN4906_c0_g1_i1.p1  ORF type:complete len:495 (+),score=6.04 TRINITY_DN4906_c0_g1_i1:214-1698(+)